MLISERLRGKMSEEKAIHTIIFDGLVANWRVWKLKFLAKATSQGYCDVLEGLRTVPPDDVMVTAGSVEENYRRTLDRLRSQESVMDLSD